MKYEELIAWDNGKGKGERCRKKRACCFFRVKDTRCRGETMITRDE
jgi:hypothetical protein